VSVADGPLTTNRAIGIGPAPLLTVRAAVDCDVFSDPLMTAVPGASNVTTKGIVRDADATMEGTVATALLLLASEILTVLVGTADSVTMPVTLEPSVPVMTFNSSAEIVSV